MSAASASNKLANEAGVLALGRLLSVLSESLMMLAIVRIMGKAEMGAFSAVLLVYQTAVLIARAGFPPATTYFVTGGTRPERRAAALHITRVLVGLGAVVGAGLAGLALLAEHLPSAASDLLGDVQSLRYLLILAPLPLLELPTHILPNLLVLEGQARSAAWFNVVRSLSMTAALIVPVAAQQSLWVVGGSLLVFGVFLFLLFLFHVRRLYRGTEKTQSTFTTRELFRYAMPLGMTDVIAIINTRADRYLILSAYSAARFAEYQVGSFQVPFISNVPYDVNTVMAPRLRLLFKEGRAEEAIAEWRLSIHKVALLVVPVAMVFTVGAEEFIGLLFPADYSESADVFRWYTLLTMWRGAAFGSVIAAAGAPHLVMRAITVTFISNVLLSLVLLYWIGFLGPAIGTTLSFIPGTVAYCYYISIASGVPLKRVYPLMNYLGVILLSLVAALPAFAIKWFTDGPPLLKFLGEGLSLLLLFGLLGSFTGQIKRQDWQFLLQWVKLKPARG